MNEKKKKRERARERPFCFNFENLRAKPANEDYMNAGHISIAMVLSWSKLSRGRIEGC